ncbi:helix-turn-helix domain-containing protein [Labilibacter sediminis]|nr:helix-turn-helix domain-containing protein [Labilibacter sediminis]
MHNQIKTYELNNQSNEKIDFVLKKIEDLYDKFNGIKDAAHRHDYYTIVLVKNGTGTHTIDFKEFPIKDYSLHFVYPGQVHQFITTERPLGWVLNFSPVFLVQNNISQDIINRVYLYNVSGDSPPLNISKNEFEPFENFVKQIETYNTKNITYKYEAAGALLKLLFIQTTTICSLQINNTISAGTGVNNLLINFKTKIEKQFQSSHKVSEYAADLAVSSDYLNKYIKAQTGKSAKEFIQERIILEAKRLLLFTDKSNKELAYQLGFEEPAHFSNFFKKITDTTPGKFRQNHHTITE